jgi:hypothetical protein
MFPQLRSAIERRDEAVIRPWHLTCIVVRRKRG